MQQHNPTVLNMSVTWMKNVNISIVLIMEKLGVLQEKQTWQANIDTKKLNLFIFKRKKK